MTVETWTAISAFCTAAMAIATTYLAWKTRSMATEAKGVAEATLKVAQATLDEANAVVRQSENTKRQVAVSSEALRASVQPWLVWVPPSQSPHDRTIEGMMVVENPNGLVTGMLKVRNVGTGIAILNMSESNIYPRNGPVPYEGIRPTTKSLVLPQGEVVDVEFQIPASQSASQQKMTTFELAGGDGRNEIFAIEIAYSDLLGLGLTRTKFHAHRDVVNKTPWTICEICYALPNGKVVKVPSFGH